MPLLEVVVSEVFVRAESISRRFPVQRGLFGRAHVHAVSDVNLTVRRGEIVALVGESGSGKSTIGRLLLGLQPVSDGRILIGDTDISTLSASKMRGLRRRMQIIFQDPYSSLDPRRRIGEQITEGMVIHDLGDAATRRARAEEMLAAVGLSGDLADRYPNQFSGGQRQRIAIARALATNPEFIVADEPVSALDVSVQAQILKLLAGLQRKLGLTMLFISHDLAVVGEVADSLTLRKDRDRNARDASANRVSAWARRPRGPGRGPGRR